jgi:hypothetical protein
MQTPGNDPQTTAAQRLLAAMHATCSHDLPNQILALQSLVHLMEIDDALPAGAEGHEYFRRLKAVTEKKAGLTDFLKALARLARYAPQPREIVLRELFRELEVEMRSGLGKGPTWDLSRLSGQVRVDRNLVYPSLGAVLRALAPEGSKTVAVASSKGTRMIAEIVIGGSHLRMATLEQNCEFLLARERLFAASIDLKVVALTGDEAKIVLEFRGASY